jgi:GntR family transcriptional repressor for pyruvate dehydrogenase complex
MTLSSADSHSKSRAEEISAILRDEILCGQYRPGERLPSERDLAIRFATNRGAVRESLKKLEQLGIAAIKPGGVRVIPVEAASLSILGPLLDLESIPNAHLVDQVLEVLGALISQSARSAVSIANAGQIQQLLDLVKRLQQADNDTETSHEHWKALARLFAHINDNLVLHLMLNGLKTQFVARMGALGLQVKMSPEENQAILRTIAEGLEQGHADQVSGAITRHFDLLRHGVERALRTRLNQQAPITANAANFPKEPR